MRIDELRLNRQLTLMQMTLILLQSREKQRCQGLSVAAAVGSGIAAGIVP